MTLEEKQKAAEVVVKALLDIVRNSALDASDRIDAAELLLERMYGDTCVYHGGL
jgi:hypothetical protein